MQEFAPGNVVRFSAILTQVVAGRVDPGTIALYVWQSGQPIGSPLTPEHDSPGAFHYDYLIDIAAAPGKWVARYVSLDGTPDATALQELVFRVTPLNT